MWTIIEGQDVRINPKEIPEHVMEYLAKDTLAAARRFYANAENREKFKKWKAEREAQRAKEAQRIDV